MPPVLPFAVLPTLDLVANPGRHVRSPPVGSMILQHAVGHQLPDGVFKAEERQIASHRSHCCDSDVLRKRVERHYALRCARILTRANRQALCFEAVKDLLRGHPTEEPSPNEITTRGVHFEGPG